MTNFGCGATATASAARWHIPPDNSPGNADAAAEKKARAASLKAAMALQNKMRAMGQDAPPVGDLLKKIRKQFAAEEVVSDHHICKLRYTCEVAFSRLLKESALMDVIRSELFPIIEAMVSWGHAMMNLAKPLKHPKCMSKQYFESNPALFHLREGCKK